MNGRGQFEIMGLAIVVVIISMAVFFFLVFAFNPEGQDAPAQFFEEQFSQNVLDALLKTTLDGCTGTIADFLTWNLTGSYPANPPAGTLCHPVNRGEEVLEAVLDSALTEYQGLPYRFQVRKRVCASPFGGGCDVRMDFGEGECNPRVQQTGRAGRQLISLYPYQTEPAEIVLWLCRPQ